MTESPSSPKCHHLLWTSGWDSTFRLLDLLHSTDHIIQPYYLYSAKRKSADVEMLAITNIIRRISRNPDWEGRVLHPIIRLAHLYRWQGTIYEQALESIKKQIHLGDQYRYLSLYRDQEKLENLELGLVKGQGAAYNYLKNWVVEVPGSPGEYMLGDDAPEDVRILFRGFRFPLMFTSKVEMSEIAKQKGFLDVLEMSWFCHKPVNKKACGTCHPCIVTIESGMGRRVGEFGLARYAEMKNPPKPKSRFFQRIIDFIRGKKPAASQPATSQPS